MGALDEEQAAWALAEGRVLFTQDEDFLGIDCARSRSCRHRLLSAEDAKHRADRPSLTDIWEILEPPRWRDGSSTSEATDDRPTLDLAPASDYNGTQRSDLSPAG